MIIQVDLQRMHVSCDADQAYSEGCCELSSTVSHPVVMHASVYPYKFWLKPLIRVLLPLAFYSVEDMQRLASVLVEAEPNVNASMDSRVRREFPVQR